MQADIGQRTDEGYRPVSVAMNDGVVEARWYEAPDSARAVVYVGGAGDEFDTPANALYPRMCAELVDRASGLRVRFRDPRDLSGCVEDVVAGVRFLSEQGVSLLGLVGHSLGGAVVIDAAAAAASVQPEAVTPSPATSGLGPETRAVVALATQSHGAHPASLPEECALLLVHGSRDRVLPESSSRTVYEEAHEPKSIHILPGAGHVLDEAAEEVHDLTLHWLERWLL